MQSFFEEYKYPIIGGLMALVLAFLIVEYGFFKTLFLLIATIGGVMMGIYVSKLEIFSNKK